MPVCSRLKPAPEILFITGALVSVDLKNLTGVWSVRINGHSIKYELESLSGGFESWNGVLEWNSITAITMKLYYLPKLWQVVWIAPWAAQLFTSSYMCPQRLVAELGPKLSVPTQPHLTPNPKFNLKQNHHKYWLMWYSSRHYDKGMNFTNPNP